jgi:hypothetical protein
MAFTPTFIDLVRNYTSTTGTADFVLGAAVSGYSSFAEAVPAGASFYYSATGIDKPTEFEVGRGTMQADGTIAREPIGAATDFSNGYKAVALVAAAEWYASTQAATATAPVSSASREAVAALADKAKPALLHEPRREGLFTFSAADLSAEVGSDVTQAVYIPPVTDPSGSSGAWVRRFEGPLQAGWFGAAGDGATDDFEPIQQALTFAGAAAGKHIQVPAGTYRVSKPLSVPNGVILEGSGANSVLIASNASGTEPWVINVAGGSEFTIRNMKLTPTTGGTYRSGIYLSACTHAKIENITVQGQTDGSGIFLWDCDSCVVDNIYFDGGAGRKGYGAYAVGCKGCKIVNSTAINCNQGFCLSGKGTDPQSTRTIDETFGNTIANCYVRYCTTQAFNINSSTYNTMSNCHAEDYSGTSTHKAFQTKDVSGDDTRGNVFIGCTVKNYPAGFGGQQASHAQFIGCTGRDLSTNGFELVSCSDFQIIGCSIVEFGEAGIWTSGGTVRCHLDNITLETSAKSAKGIVITSSGGTDGENNFDSVTTKSALAAFIDIGSAARNNRFGMGCRPAGNPIVDSSQRSIWPLVFKTDAMPLDSVGSKYGAYINSGMQLAVARFVVTQSIGGAPSVAAGRLGETSSVAPSQPVSGAAGIAVALTLASQSLPAGSVMSGTTAVAGTGEGYVQFEGLPA